MDFYLLLGRCSAYAGNRSDQTSNSRLDCAPLNSDPLQPRPVYIRSCGSQISGLAMKCQRGIHFLLGVVYTFYLEGYTLLHGGVQFYLEGYIYTLLLEGVQTFTWRDIHFYLEELRV